MTKKITEGVLLRKDKKDRGVFIYAAFSVISINKTAGFFVLEGGMGCAFQPMERCRTD